jgi:cobalt-zinc-cadmium efflux system membrane fusion protein
MNHLRGNPFRYAGVVVLGLLILAGVTVVLLGGWMPFKAASPPERPVAPAAKTATAELVPNMPYTLMVPEDVRKALGIAEAAPAEPPKTTRPLVMPGSTALDPSRVSRIKTRFNAEVIEIAQVPEDPTVSKSMQTVFRELRTGDKVKKGDTLAVVFSVDVGGKKSDLVDALVQLKLDEERLKTRTALAKKGVVPEDTLNQTRRDVISDRNAVDRAERTLRVWNIPDKEIEAVRQEADQLLQREGKRDKEKEKRWARSELIAPRDGTLVERNVGVGEYVADNTISLFTIADVDHLQVIANPPEEALPALLELKGPEKQWTLQTVGVDPLHPPTLPFSEVGYLIDPNQHTAVVKGYLPNPDGQLRAGQFVSATVQMPPPPDVVEVPLTALAEDGKQSFVFVQPDPTKHNYTMRRVKVVLRFETVAFVRSQLKPEEEKLTPEEVKQGLQPLQPLKPGERILTTGVLELRAALEDKMSKAKQGR